MLDRTRVGARLYLLCLSCAAVALVAPPSALAASDDADFWLGSLQNNLRWTVDLSSRPVHFSDNNEIGAVHAIGFDTHKVFSNSSGDLATIVAQGYMTRVDNLQRQPGFFDDQHDWEFIYRIFNINFTALGPAVPNVRFGHFEIPFGLEHLLDTNGTLRDYHQGRKLGMKADWGVTLNDSFEYFEYEVSASLGGVQDFTRRDDSYAFSGRIGTPGEENSIFGLSYYVANLGKIDRQRIGVDHQYYVGRFGVFSEFAIGETDDDTDITGLFELNWRNSDEVWLLYVQWLGFFRDRNTGWTEDLSAMFGIKFEPDAHWTLSAQVTQEFQRQSPAQPDETITALQLRYRF